VARYAGKIVTTLPGTQKRVALTFDGGADARGAERIVATLRAAGVPASFFVTGKFAQANPRLVTTLASIGPVGNHTWDHPHLPTLSTSAVQGQLDRTRAQISAVGAGAGMPFFRFPFGESTSATLKTVNDAGYVAVGWTVDSLGWQGTSGGQTAAKVTDRVVGAQRPGEIVLMHLGGHPTDNSTLDADALPEIIRRLAASGYTFVTLDALGR
jgi:peptidoglycan/xylan/chitin deacetylase (PgdA/CDA1 family)